MKLVQVRTCDGACCVESPRFPNEDHTDCKYRDATQPEQGCKIMAGTASLGDGQCPVLPDLTEQQAFDQTCTPWPGNSEPKAGETANCCYQWVNDGD